MYRWYYIGAMTARISIAGNHFAISYNGVGSGLTSVPRSSLVPAAINTIVINDGSGNLSTVAQIPPSQGGTGLNTSALTGVAKVSGGTWSVANVVDADVASGAAIGRGKLAAGVANHVIINNSSGVLSSEAQLSTSRGGTGIDASIITGPSVLAVNNGAVSSISYSTSAGANSLVQRDGSGNITANQVALSGISGNFTHGNSVTFVGTAQTIGATTATILTIPTTVATTYSLSIMLAANDVGLTGSVMISYLNKVKNNAGVLTISSPVNMTSLVDAGLETATSSVVASGSTIQIRVVGITGKTLNWSGRMILVSA